MSVHDILNSAGLFGLPSINLPIERDETIETSLDMNAKTIRHIVGDGGEQEITVKAVYVHTETFEIDRIVAVSGPRDGWIEQINTQLNELTDIPLYEWTGPVDKDTILERWSYDGQA